MNANKEKNSVMGLLLAAAVAATVFLVTPVGIYLANSGEFITPLLQLLLWWAIPAIGMLLVLMTVGLIIPARWYPRYLLLLATLYLLVWFQADVLLWNYGLLDGRTIDWAAQSWRGWVDSLLWLCVLALTQLFYRKLYQPMTFAALLIFVVQFLPVLYGGLTQAHRAELSKAGVLEQLADFSPQKNVVHLLLDGFQSDFFDELMRHPEIGDAYRHELSGFTFYRENLGIFPYTQFAVPAILSGEIYTNQVPKDQFIRDAIAGNSIFNAATDAGMEVDLASMQYWAPLYASARHQNGYVLPLQGHASPFEFRVSNTTKLLDLALFRIAPHFLKQKIYNNQRWLLSRLLIDHEYMQFNYFSHTQFLLGLAEKMTATRSAPTYKFIHVMNTHNPMVVDARCDYVGRAMKTTRPTLLFQSKCTLDTVVRLFIKMKHLGIYDNSVIVMHGDHGGWVPHSSYQPERVNQHLQLPYWAVSLGSPLLAIKPAQAKGPLVTSDALASITDLADTMADLMDWPQQFNGKSLLRLEEGASRIRRFYIYLWQRDEWETDYAGLIQEFEISGKHYESAWVPKRTFEHH